MFTVVYVVVDDEKLVYYNEMMKSLTSLRMHMPEQKAAVLMDSDTCDRLYQKNSPIFDMAEVVSVKIGDDYSLVEKSRLLKITARERVKGDLLYIDTDTVICQRLPEIDTNKSIGMVLDLHSLRSEINWYLTDEYDKQSGLDLHNFDYFYNGGLVWSRDDEHAHRFYQKWHALWEQTRKRGIPRDQSPLNYIVQEEFEHIETLDGVWNAQLARAFSIGLNYLADAYIIHYFNHATSAYLLCKEEYKNLPYDDPKILEMLKTPKSLFDKCRLIRLDAQNHSEDKEFLDWCENQYRFRRYMKMYKPIENSEVMKLAYSLSLHPSLFHVIDKCLGFMRRVKHFMIR